MGKHTYRPSVNGGRGTGWKALVTVVARGLDLVAFEMVMNGHEGLGFTAKALACSIDAVVRLSRQPRG